MGPYLLLASTVSVIWFWTKNISSKGRRLRDYNTRTDQLAQQYMQALAGTNKIAALLAGRAYYSHIRHGDLTISDEQTLITDLSRMQ